MALDFFHIHNQWFFFPHSEVIYIRNLKTNTNIFLIIIFYFFKQASKRNPTTWSRFIVSSSTFFLALEPDGTWVSLEEWQREMLGANCWFYHSNTKFVTPLYRSQGKQLYCGSIFHSMAVLGIKVSFYDGKKSVLLFYLLLKIKKYHYYNAFEVLLPPTPTLSWNTVDYFGFLPPFD